MPSPHAAEIVLTDAERTELEGWTRRRTSAAGLALRAKIVLAAADGGTNVEFSDRLGGDRSTIRKWRNRFNEFHCDGLLDEPRPGRPRVVGDARIEALITATLETTPPNATHWSTRSMAEHLEFSQSMVSRVWRAFGLAPHKLSKDPLFVAKVRDVVGLYLKPAGAGFGAVRGREDPDPGAQPDRPGVPDAAAGAPARASHDYVRHGTSSVYAALDVSTGKVIGSPHSRHRSQKFLAFLKKIDTEVPGDLDVHLVLDNASTHKTPAAKRWLTAHPRFVLHFTPPVPRGSTSSNAASPN